VNEISPIWGDISPDRLGQAAKCTPVGAARRQQLPGSVVKIFVDLRHQLLSAPEIGVPHTTEPCAPLPPPERARRRTRPVTSRKEHAMSIQRATTHDSPFDAATVNRLDGLVRQFQDVNQTP